MGSMFIDTKPLSKNNGASRWSVNDVTSGSKKYKEKVRSTVNVISKGHNKPILNILREGSANLMGVFYLMNIRCCNN